MKYFIISNGSCEKYHDGFVEADSNEVWRSGAQLPTESSALFRSRDR
jgi:hypothetical protein